VQAGAFARGLGRRLIGLQCNINHVCFIPVTFRRAAIKGG
jgi:hypothetical protein